MSNNVKDININIINIKEFDSNIKLDESSYKKYSYLLHYIAYATIKDLKYVKINSLFPLYLMFNRINRYFEEINGNNYLMLVLTNERTVD